MNKCNTPRRSGILLVLFLGVLMGALDIAIVAPALPSIQTFFGVGARVLTWTFTIRSGVKWQDGVPLTAHDVAFTYTFMMKYKLQAFLASLQAIKTVTAPNDTTVVITCTRPKADILSMWVPILPQHI